MRAYLAGFHTGASPLTQATIEYPYILESYHYINKQKQVDKIRMFGRRVFLDSGAFSAFTQGIEIDVDGYAEYIKRNQDIIEVASVLDGIGDPVLTKANQKRLEDQGVEVLPCFHYNEPWEYLEYYVENYDYITLGGMVPISTRNLYVWLDQCWAHFLTDEQGWPRIKVHGFGLTVLPLMLRYPWFSVDSTSWILSSRFGLIFFPTDSNPVYKLAISEHSPKTKDQFAHFNTLSDPEKELVEERIRNAGFDPEELRTQYWIRDHWNIEYFRSLCEREPFPFKLEQPGLLY